MASVDQPALTIIVVSYNTRAMTLACLESVVRETRATSYELLVVDNASKDGSAAAIAAHPGPHRLIALDQNVGFARANNLAARMARGRHILLLNPDTEVRDGAIDKLMHFAAAQPQARIWGGRTIFADGRLNPASAWGRMTPWRLLCRATGLTGVFPRSSLFNGEAYGAWNRDRERDVDIVSGCFLLIERALWQTLDGFHPAYFMYGEDSDLCLRAARHGARPRITPEATIVHHGGASETVRADKMVRLLTAKASLIRHHFPRATVALGLALQAGWPLSRTLALHLMARLTRSERHAKRAAEWAEIWQRRREWLTGYDEPPAPTLSDLTPPSAPTPRPL